MKRIYKILIIIFASLLLFFILLSLIAGPIAKNYIEKNSKELCNRNITIDKLRINIFFGIVRIDGLTVMEEDNATLFFTFDKLKINASLAPLLSKKVKLTRITLIQPKATIIQTDSIFNFSDIIAHFSNDEQDAPKESSPWNFDLRKITLENGNFVYQDAVINSNIDLREFSLQIPKIAFSTDNTKVGIDLKFADGGNLNLKMLLDQEANQYNLETTLKNLKINILKPYLKNIVNISELDGLLSTHLNIKGALNHIMELSLRGNVDLDKLKIKDLNNKELSTCNNLHLEIENIDLSHNIYQLNQVSLSDFSFNYDIFENGSSLSLLTCQDDTLQNKEKRVSGDTAKSSQNSKSKSNFKLTVTKCRITNAKINYCDYSLGGSKPFKLPITKINIFADGLSTNHSFPVTIEAIIGNGGELLGNWQGSLSDFSNQSINISLKNIKLDQFSPYCLHYTAFPISDGLLNFQTTNHIVNNNLTSQNKINIYKCKVGKKNKELAPEVKIPLKAALYILTDRKGSIDIDLPVSGDISSPKFSFKKLIFKTLGNFLIKVATSPVNFISDAINDNKSIFTDISMPYDKIILTSEHYTQLNKICALFKEKEEYNLTIATSLDSLDFQTVNSHNDTIYDPKMGQIKEEISHSLLHYFSTQGIDNKRIIFIDANNEKIKSGEAIISLGIQIDELTDN